MSAATAAAALTLSACGSSDSGSDSSKSGADKGAIKVVTSFYPLTYATEQIGGKHVDVTSLTKPGVEPHDLELTPQQVAVIPGADLTVYEKGFQKAVDDAVKSNAKSDKVLDVDKAADLNLKTSDTTSVGPQDEEEGHDHGDEHGDEHGHDHDEDGMDPHFWNDPVRYKAVAEDIGKRLEKADPDHADDYKKNTAAFTKKLDELNQKFDKTLKTCKNRNLVTGHAAFGYLAKRYNLTQVGVAGVSPEAEPTPQRLKDVSAFIKKNHVTTVYSETLVSPKTAQTIAKETGAKVEVLDPIEGITKESKGQNYFEVMDSNLATLKKGQSCS